LALVCFTRVQTVSGDTFIRPVEEDAEDPLPPDDPLPPEDPLPPDDPP